MNATDENGSIVDLRIVDGGEGYEPTFVDFFTGAISNTSGLARIVVTGGGGNGALIFGEVDATGSISDVFVLDGGSGYYNFDVNNTVSASITPASTDKNASLLVTLGGSLMEPTLNNTRGTFSLFDGFMTNTVSTNNNPTPPFSEFRYAAPWVMILDKGRPENSIREADRAHAVAKVEDGKITKVIVTKGGSGYIDPHVVICGTSPRYANQNDGRSTSIPWQWRCTNMRETITGDFVMCGHVDSKSYPYPPENCPGEEVGVFRTDDNWDQAFDNWAQAHVRNQNHPNCNGNHLTNQFVSPICSGKKANFVLINDFYRAGNSGTYEDWAPFETNCTATLDGGRVREIKIVNDVNGKYLAPEIAIVGRGAGTQPVPIFDQEGILTRIFYDDPELKSLEIDKIGRPFGAGQGYFTKTWSKDDKYRPAFGPEEAIRCLIYTDILYWDPAGPTPEHECYDFNYTFTNGVQVRDPYGDRISDVRVLDGGSYAVGDYNVTLDYNGSFIPDFNQDGYPDFEQGKVRLISTNRLTSIVLDGNGTHLDNNFQTAEGYKITTGLWRNTFLAEPDVKIFDELNGVKLSHYDDELSLTDIRLSGAVQYDPESQKSYLDIVVDDDLSSNFFYGLGDSNRSGMGGEVLVYEAMPGFNWGKVNDWDAFALTDENGTYSLANLEPGLYNMAVFIEDENFQDIALRPDNKPGLYSRTFYVAGFDPITIETDNRGNGRSRLIWSKEARDQSRLTGSIHNDPLKDIEGIGVGFEIGKKYNFNITAHASNTTQAIPKIDYEVLSDGSLRFKIIDNADTSIFDPNDKFTISYSSTVSGIDFSNPLDDGIIGNSFWGGDKAAINFNVENNTSYILSLTPQSGNELNSIEVPLRTLSDSNASMTFTFSAYDENGSVVDCSNVTWTLIPEFTVTDGNLSKVAQLESPQYYKEGNGGMGYGFYYPVFSNPIYLDSNTSGSGVYSPLDPASLGGFHQHNFTGMDLPVFMENPAVNPNIFHAAESLPVGNLLEEIQVDYNVTNRINLVLHSTMQDTGLILKATLPSGQSVSTRITAARRSVLTEKEIWFDKYFGTILESAIPAGDSDGDGLTLEQEWQNRTNPDNNDTDGDSLNDFYETTVSKTNPNSADTDGDGFSDGVELNLYSKGYDPLSYNANRPLPSITALYENGGPIASQPGAEVNFGAKAVETNLQGIDDNLTINFGGTFQQVVSYSNSKWVVNKTAPTGTYKIVYSAIDSLNRTVQLTQDLVINSIDVTPPVITLSNNGPIYVLKGSMFNEPTVSAFDAGDNQAVSVTTSGLSMIDVNQTGEYKVTYQATDSSGQTATTVLTVIVEDFAFTLSGKAIDGYLTGATVIFDGRADPEGFDGLHDLDRTILTDGSGSFSLQLTSSEMNIFDENNNSVLDAEEGRIIVTGGYDPSLDSNFTGRYVADVNSSVISPLSTLVSAMMDQGLSEDAANTKVASAFGFPNGTDATNYDPIASSLSSDSNSPQILVATARLANAMKQADAMASYLSIPTTSAGQVSTDFISRLATSLKNSPIDSNPLDDTSVLNQALTSSLQSVQPTVQTSEISNAVSLIESADNLLVQTLNSAISSGTSPSALAVGLVKNQQAVEGAIINEYTNPANPNLSSVSNSVSLSSLSTLSDSVDTSLLNIFPPIAQDFDQVIRSDQWSSGVQLMSISASDGDGDAIIYTITSSNFDLDADGNPPS